MCVCVRVCVCVCVCVCVFSRLRRLRRLIAWVHEEVESVGGMGFVSRRSSVSSPSSSRIILDKV
jgi:hypothetical protein